MSDELRPQIMTRLPADTKATGGRRVDFRPKDFDQFIGVKGLKYWWSRSLLCPCQNNSQTDQADITCSLCNGHSWLSFLPDPTLDGQQEDAYGYPVELNDLKTAVSIRAVVTGITKDPADFERFGRWIMGTAKVTVQSANRIGYRDRLKARDNTLSMTQLITGDGDTEIIVTGMRSEKGLFTPVAVVNMLRSVAAIYKEDQDFVVTDSGTISWTITPPTSGTQLSIHYDFHPTWVVMDHPYAARDTYIIEKTGDNFKRLPLNTTVKLDFLTTDTND